MLLEQFPSPLFRCVGSLFSHEFRKALILDSSGASSILSNLSFSPTYVFTLMSSPAGQIHGGRFKEACCWLTVHEFFHLVVSNKRLPTHADNRKVDKNSYNGFDE